MNNIDIQKYINWPYFEPFINQLIQKYESESSRPKMSTDKRGVVIFEAPSESDLSIGGYSIAETADSSANTVRNAVNYSQINHAKRKNRVRSALYSAADDTREDLIEQGGAVGETLATGRSTFEFNLDDLARGDGSGFANGIPVVEDVVEWFADCYDCDGRIIGTLSTDLTLPEILIELGDFLGDIEDVLDTAFNAFDSSRALARMCAILPLGRWCPPDLMALLGVLASLLQQYWLINPLLEFNWWGIVAALLYPILQAAYSVLGMGLNLSVQPVNCLIQILRDIRGIVHATERLDSSLGLSLGHTAATVQTTFSNDRQYSQEILDRLHSKQDWFSGDTLGEYSEVLGLLSPIETSLLSIKDFQAKLTNLSEWFSSRLRALRSQSREAAFATLKFTNVMMAIARLYNFLDALLKLVVHGKEVCQEKFDDDGNPIFILSKPVDELYAEAGVLPPWVDIQRDPSSEENDGEVAGPQSTGEVSGPTSDDPPLTSNQSFTIIDTSLGTRQVNIGCLGHVTEEEAKQVQNWINELDAFSEE